MQHLKITEEVTSHYTAEIPVLTAACMKMIVFWDVAPCSLVDSDRRFRVAYCLHHQGGAGGIEFL
jgi:hypothetical protein